MMPDPKQAPVPEAIFQILNAYQQTAAAKAAIELDVFTAIAQGARDERTLAERCKASARGVRILCDYLVVSGLLTKDNNSYGLTPTSATFLDRSSPMYMGTVAQFLTSPDATEGFRDLASAVRKGGTVLEQRTLETENPMWINFARSMVPLMMPAAEEIAGLIGADRGHKWKVLDVAAGHGMFGITIAAKNRDAEVVAQDWKGILDVARENADRAGLGSRFRTLPGSALEVDFGADYDVALLTNFLHHFDKPTCERLLGKVFQALKPDGCTVILEFVPNEDRVSPPAPAAFGLTMLASTPSGDVYTFSEYQTMLERAGFSSSEMHMLKRSPEQVIISRK
jgi:2-polyprenyl-3-methyl-5-hydroxy-6-metoxy-1,4-benzoquinol methylase